MNVNQHRKEDGCSKNHIERKGANSRQGEPVLQDSENHRAQKRPDDGSGAARQESASDDRRCDGHKHNVGPSGQRIS